MMIRYLIIGLLFGLQLAVAQAQSTGRSALIVIDMQEEFTKNSMDSIASGVLIESINDIIAAAVSSLP